MRVTNLMLSQNLLNNLENIQTQMQTTENELSTGKKISQPSDDPGAVEMVLGLNSSISKVNQWQTNASQGLSFLQTSDSTMGNITDLLTRAKDLAVQAANGTSTDSDRKLMVSEVSQITQQIGQLSNTEVGGKYVFAGTSTTAPWDSANPTNWMGNSGTQSVEVGKGTSVPINVDTTSLFQGTSGNPSVFQVLNQFVSDLNNNNVNGIQSDMNAIDNQSQNFMTVRAQIGAQTDRIQTVQQQLSQSLVSLKQNLSDAQDADVAQVITQLTTQQNVYQAALAVGAKYIQPSLVDFISG